MSDKESRVFIVGDDFGGLSRKEREAQWEKLKSSNPPTAPDSTGCVHRMATIMGMWQCSRCYRIFEEQADGVLRAPEPALPPGPSECALMDWEEWEALGKLEEIRAMLPDLEENRSTKSVARKIRAILGDS